MNEPKNRLERLINQVCQMVFDLLRSLDVCKSMKLLSNPIHIFVFRYFMAFSLFQLELHVSADPSDIRMLFHVMIHFEDGAVLRSEPSVEQNGELRIEDLLVTKTVKKPVVRWKFPAVFVLDTQKQVHLDFFQLFFLLQCVVLLLFWFLFFFIFGLDLIKDGHLTVLILWFFFQKNTCPKRIHIRQMISTCNVLITVSFGFPQSWVNDGSTSSEVVCVFLD